jgi:hypothetical protein
MPSGEEFSECGSTPPTSLGMASIEGAGSAGSLVITSAATAQLEAYRRPSVSTGANSNAGSAAIASCEKLSK